MREQEIKLAITSQQAQKLLAQKLTWSTPAVQEDIIFAKKGRDFKQVPLGEPILRIRNGKLFTLKKRLSDGLNKEEHEITISDPIAMSALIENLGFSEVVRITKSRRTAKFAACTICLDTVEHLGLFCEIEYLGPEDAQQILRDVMTQLDIEGEEVQQGYDELLYSN